LVLGRRKNANQQNKLIKWLFGYRSNFLRRSHLRFALAFLIEWATSMTLCDRRNSAPHDGQSETSDRIDFQTLDVASPGKRKSIDYLSPRQRFPNIGKVQPDRRNKCCDTRNALPSKNLIFTKSHHFHGIYHLLGACLTFVCLKQQHQECPEIWRLRAVLWTIANTFRT